MKKNTSGTSGEGGQNPVVTPTKPPDREHELSRDCWCQPIVDGAAPDGIDLDRQIVRMRGEVEHCKELHGDGSEWAVESGSILASLIELRDLRQQLAAERLRVVELPPLTDVMYHAARGLEFDFGGGEDAFKGQLNDDCLDEIWDAINTAMLRAAGSRHDG